MTHDDVIVIHDIHGEEEKCRYLWMCRGKIWVKSLTHKHKKNFGVHPDKVIRNEGQPVKKTAW